MEPKEIVGKAIREHRLRQELTQEQLADRAGLHAVEISRAERGVRDLRISTLAKIAAGLSVPASELVWDLNDPGAQGAERIP